MYLEATKSWYEVNSLLLRRIERQGRQSNIMIAPESLREQIIKDMHGDIMIGHKSTLKTKGRIIGSYWCQELMARLISMFKAVTSSKRHTE
jgi:hypothetical protein